MSALPQHLINVLPPGLPLAHNLSWDRVGFFACTYIIAMMIFHFQIRGKISRKCRIGLLTYSELITSRNFSALSISNKICDVFVQILTLMRFLFSISIAVWTMMFMIYFVLIKPHVTLTFTGWIYGFSAFSRMTQAIILLFHLFGIYCCNYKCGNNRRCICKCKCKCQGLKICVWILHQTSLTLSIMVTIVYHTILRSPPNTILGWKNYISNDFMDVNVHALNGLLAIIDFVLCNPNIDVSITIFPSCIAMLYVMLWWIIAPMYRLGMPYYFMSYWDGSDLLYYLSFMILSFIISCFFKLIQVFSNYCCSFCCQSYHCNSNLKSTKTD